MDKLRHMHDTRVDNDYSLIAPAGEICSYWRQIAISTRLWATIGQCLLSLRIGYDYSEQISPTDTPRSIRDSSAF